MKEKSAADGGARGVVRTDTRYPSTQGDLFDLINSRIINKKGLDSMGYVTWRPLLVLLPWHPLIHVKYCNCFEDREHLDET